MKKITLLFVMAAMALSCSDDNNNNVSVNGTWKLTYVKLNREGYDGNKDGVISDNFIDEYPCLGNSIVTFQSDSTAVFTMGDIGNGQLVAPKNDPSICPMKTPENVTYIANGNSLEFTYTTIDIYPGSKIKRSFKRSGNKLIATLDVDGTEQYIPGSGEYGDVNFYSYTTFVFTKQ